MPAYLLSAMPDAGLAANRSLPCPALPAATHRTTIGSNPVSAPPNFDLRDVRTLASLRDEIFRVTIDVADE